MGLWGLNPNLICFTEDQIELTRDRSVQRRPVSVGQMWVGSGLS